MVAASQFHGRTMDDFSVSARVDQIYGAYLTAVFRNDYYRRVHEVTRSYASHMDFAIGLGTAGSGGSGLGILASPNFAWLCAVLTTGSTVLAIAKATYNWPDCLQKAIELENYYNKIASEYKILVDDLQAYRAWRQEFETKHKDLREKSEKPPIVFTYRNLSTKRQREIQNSIKERIPYHSWWKPDGAIDGKAKRYAPQQPNQTA